MSIHRLALAGWLAGWLVVASWLVGSQPVAAQQSQTILDQIQGEYRLIATLEPTPLIVGDADLTIEVRDAATDQPRKVSAINVLIKSQEVGLEKLYVSPPDPGGAGNIHRSHRLYFSSAGLWDVRIQLLDQERQHNFITSVNVGSVAGRIVDAALLTVPAFLALLVLAMVGWRLWQRRRASRAAQL